MQLQKVYVIEMFDPVNVYEEEIGGQIMGIFHEQESAMKRADVLEKEYIRCFFEVIEWTVR